MACLCTNRKERGKIDNPDGRHGCWKEILSKREQIFSAQAKWLVLQLDYELIQNTGRQVES